jgi:hydroxymethylbilane synthase
MPLLIGTRGSALATAQAGRVLSILTSAGVPAGKRVITTEGDLVTGVPLHEIGGQGVFVRALDDAILAGEIDAAVHSMKDIPAIRPQGLVTAAVLPRDSPGDFLAHHIPREEVRVIGTSSTRRRAQMLRHDPAAIVSGIRGNVDTRLRKLEEGQYDAVMLAAAGTERLGLAVPGTLLPTDEFVPAPNQGVIAVVCRDDEELVETLLALDDPATRFDTACERAAMEELGGGCYTPIGIFCRKGVVTAEVLSLEGTSTVRVEEEVATPGEAGAIGRRLRKDAAGLIHEAERRLKR